MRHVIVRPTSETPRQLVGVTRCHHRVRGIRHRGRRFLPRGRRVPRRSRDHGLAFRGCGRPGRLMSPRSCAVRACPPAFVNVQEIANAPSTSAAVPIALGDGGRCGVKTRPPPRRTRSDGRWSSSSRSVRLDVNPGCRSSCSTRQLSVTKEDVAQQGPPTDVRIGLRRMVTRVRVGLP